MLSGKESWKRNKSRVCKRATWIRDHLNLLAKLQSILFGILDNSNFLLFQLERKNKKQNIRGHSIKIWALFVTVSHVTPVTMNGCNWTHATPLSILLKNLSYFDTNVIHHHEQIPNKMDHSHPYSVSKHFRQNRFIITTSFLIHIW